MAVFFPFKPRNPSGQLAATLRERKIPAKRRMRLGVRLSQPAALTDRIRPALPWENRLLPAQTAHIARTARTRRWGKEQIRAEPLSRHKTRRQHIRGIGIPRGWSWRSCSCSFQPLRRRAWHWRGTGSKPLGQPLTAPPRGERGLIPAGVCTAPQESGTDPIQILAGSSCTPRHRVPAVSGGSRWL